MVSVTAGFAVGEGNLKPGFGGCSLGADKSAEPPPIGRVTFRLDNGPDGGLGAGGAAAGGLGGTGFGGTDGAEPAGAGALGGAGAGALGAAGAGDLAPPLNAAKGLPGCEPGFGGRLIRMVSFLILPCVTFKFGLATPAGAGAPPAGEAGALAVRRAAPIAAPTLIVCFGISIPAGIFGICTDPGGFAGSLAPGGSLGAEGGGGVAINYK